MKTKLIAPWNLKPGMRIVLETVPRDMARDGNPRSFLVSHITKYRSGFTGCNAWRVKYNDSMSSLGYSTTLYHGQRKPINKFDSEYKYDKVLIEVQPEVKATVTPKGIKFNFA